MPKSTRIAKVVLFAILVLAGCQKRVQVAAVPPSPVTLPPPPPPAPAPPVSALDQADRAFTSGHYDEAALAYDDYLRITPSGGHRDQALFQLGLTYALRPAPSADWQRTTVLFKQLLDEFPNSPFMPLAKLIMSLHSDLDQLNADSKQRDQRIKQLTTELDRLKKIDADRRKSP